MMNLSEAVLKGIAARKKRAIGVYFSGENRSDVLGAAYQGLTGSSEVNNHEVGATLQESFPILSKKVHYPNDETRQGTLKEVILHLNDEKKWKRKNIARFIAAVEARNN